MAQISVIMGIYNCAATLPAAIDSILAQTFSDWELIMCDDGSGDDTYAVAMAYQTKHPRRIRVLKNGENLGLNATLNRCLREAEGDYIARMDGDDTCAPERFAEELAVLQAEPEIAIVSTAMSYFDDSGTWGRSAHPAYPQPRDLLRGTPFCHAPCLVRREAYEAVGGYSEDPRLMRVEDYHLWLKMYIAGYRGRNLDKVLYHMRDDRNAYGRRRFRYRLNEAYVKCLVVRELRLPIWGYVHALRPILVGLLPRAVYDILHKRNLRGSGDP